MHLKSVRELEFLTANREPARLHPDDPEDTSRLKRGSVALIIRECANGQEILLIKRASRLGDRWSGHVALPGGRQDPDENDFETAIRETSEEVGLDLTKHAKYIGSLEPRIIRVSWGRKIALILCPFVFSLNKESNGVNLTPQSSEVLAAFWHPLGKIYSQERRVWERIPVGDRLDFTGALKSFVSYQSGCLLFDATDIMVDNNNTTWAKQNLRQTEPWKMWGITLGILQDLRRLIDPLFTVNDIRLPTFDSCDLRILLSLFSWVSVRQKRRRIQQDPNQSDWANRMLSGHFKYFPIVIVTGISLRVAALSLAVALICRKLKKK